MPKVVKENEDAGAAAPTADDSADKPANDVVNTTPDPEVAPADAGHVNTTGNATGDEGKARRRALTQNDKQNIFTRFNAPNAQVQDIADEYDITTEEVFAIADDINSDRDD